MRPKNIISVYYQKKFAQPLREFHHALLMAELAETYSVQYFWLIVFGAGHYPVNNS